MTLSLINMDPVAADAAVEGLTDDSIGSEAQSDGEIEELQAILK